jgi:hypothetical protein
MANENVFFNSFHYGLPRAYVLFLDEKNQKSRADMNYEL